MEGRLPETVLKGGAGSGVLRPRLVTAGSGGPGHRPPGMTTWLRGARCTDPEAMPEMEARPPAENRHGGAPRGERPASWDAPRLTRADQSRLTNATKEIVRLSALRPPLHSGMDAKGKARTRAQQRAAGTNNTALFDIVSLRLRPTAHVRAASPHARVPGRAQRDPGPRSFTAKSMDVETSRRVASGSRISFRSRKGACYTRPGHETDARAPPGPHASRRSLRSLLSMRTRDRLPEDQPASRFAR